MDTFAYLEQPPADLVAFLAQRSGLSAEAAEHRLERWFGEYHASSHERVTSNSAAQADQSSLFNL